MSAGMSNAGVGAVDLALRHATEAARARGREMPTLEQLLLELLHDDAVQEMLANQGVDSEAVRTALLRHLGEATADAANGSGIDPALQSAMQRAGLKNILSNRKDMHATDLVVAILVEGDSSAARVLSEHGLTIEEAEDEALNTYLARQAEQLREIEEMRARIAEQNAHHPQSNVASLGVQSAAALPGTDHGPRLYTLRVASQDAAEQTRFKGAVSGDGRLGLYIESTPFETEIWADKVAVLLEAIDEDGRLQAELITEMEGERRRVGGFGGQAGVLFDDRNSWVGQRSGRY